MLEFVKLFRMMKKRIVFIVLLFSIFVSIKAQCWKQSYGRGVGLPLLMCPNGTELNGALCYQQCQSGYKGVGPVCWQTCKPGFTDYGLLCHRSEFVYFKQCSIINNVQMCTPCLSNYLDLGLHCKLDSNVYIKKSYSRGIGQPMVCSAEYEQDAGLCYEKCKNGFIGVGPVCWSTCDSTDYALDCGVICTENDKQCAQFVAGTGAAGLSFFSNFFFVPEDVSGGLYQSLITGVVSGASGGLYIANALLYDSCTIKNTSFYF